MLNISQPAATKRLQQAEQQLGFALFDRVRGGLQLTSKGEVLQDQIERISGEVRDLQRLASNLKASESCGLKIVSTPGLALATVPKAVTRLQRVMPTAGIELGTQHSEEMLESILLRASDIGLTLQKPDHPGIRSEVLCQGSMMVIAPSGWWSDCELSQPVPIEDLAARRIVGIAPGDKLGGQLQSHLDSLSPQPTVSILVQTYQMARSLVAKGHGLALVDPFTAIGDGDDTIQARPAAPDIPVSLYAVYRDECELNSVQKRFLECASEVSSAMMAVLEMPMLYNKASIDPLSSPAYGGSHSLACTSGECPCNSAVEMKNAFRADRQGIT
ncbi:hypothetical protein BA177_17560 [Woeseia oceani]|uniref:HTH lysR-type domain-containing protein n=2 Tax=Woeseia oceani TaxID=1548547 RepID=A0A193LJN8_9GAMM|nr:hypothetical protein BA177_17560 [Woeseia oceani]